MERSQSLTTLPLVLFALIGISGESLSSFLVIFLKYSSVLLFFLCLAGAELLADLIAFYLVELCGEILLPSAPPAGYTAEDQQDRTTETVSRKRAAPPESRSVHRNRSLPI